MNAKHLAPLIRNAPVTLIRTAVLLMAAGLLGVPSAAQVVIYGPLARTEFDLNVANYGDKLIDFNSLAIGSLSTQLQAAFGVTFSSTIQTDGTPIVPPHNVYLSSSGYGANTTLKIVGTPYPGGSDDGRVGYEIVFSTPQARAGVERDWMAGYAVTRFYNSAGTLLGTHVNTAANEFVAYQANYSDPLTWVSRIEMDGLIYLATRQVGYTDNLIYGFAPIPEPAASALLLAGLALLGFRRLVSEHT